MFANMTLHRDKFTTRRCVKVVLILINISFMVCGLLIVFVGDRLRVNTIHRYVTQLLTATRQLTSTTSSLSTPCASMTSSLLSDHVTAILSSAEALIATGCCVMIVGFVGCYGACAEKAWILGCYSVLTAILIIPEIILIFFRREMSKGLTAKLQHQVVCQYNVTAQQADNTDQLTLAWNAMQTELKCCGAKGPSDYFDSVWFNNTKNSRVLFVPPSCCKPSLELREHDIYHESACETEAMVFFVNAPNSVEQQSQLIGSLYPKGCHGLLMQSIRDDYGQTATRVISIVIVLQIIGFIFTCFLIHRIRKNILSSIA